MTTVVDTGTAGAKHFLHFKRTVIDTSKTRIFALINIVKSGMIGDFEHDIREMDPELAASIVLAYPEICVGIKTAHYWTHNPYDEAHPPWAAVDRALEAAEICKKPLMVDFWPRPERTYPELLEKMRPGDIHTHMYAQQFPVLDENNKPNDFLFEARERGMIFDLGHGAGSFWFRLAIPAMEGGWAPDSISTDLHIGNVNGPVVDMLTTMSKLLAMGMPLQRDNLSLNRYACQRNRPSRTGDAQRRRGSRCCRAEAARGAFRLCRLRQGEVFRSTKTRREADAARGQSCLRPRRHDHARMAGRARPLLDVR